MVMSSVFSPAMTSGGCDEGSGKAEERESHSPLRSAMASVILKENSRDVIEVVVRSL